LEARQGGGEGKNAISFPELGGGKLIHGVTSTKKENHNSTHEPKSGQRGSKRAHSWTKKCYSGRGCPVPSAPQKKTWGSGRGRQSGGDVSWSGEEKISEKPQGKRRGSVVSVVGIKHPFTWGGKKPKPSPTALPFLAN